MRAGALTLRSRERALAPERRRRSLDRRRPSAPGGARTSHGREGGNRRVVRPRGAARARGRRLRPVVRAARAAGRQGRVRVARGSRRRGRSHPCPCPDRAGRGGRPRRHRKGLLGRPRSARDDRRLAVDAGLPRRPRRGYRRLGQAAGSGDRGGSRSRIRGTAAPAERSQPARRRGRDLRTRPAPLRARRRAAPPDRPRDRRAGRARAAGGHRRRPRRRVAPRPTPPRSRSPRSPSRRATSPHGRTSRRSSCPRPARPSSPETFRPACPHGPEDVAS